MNKKGNEIEVTITCNNEEQLKAIAEAVRDVIIKKPQGIEKDDSNEPEPKAFQPKEGDICTCTFDERVDAIFRYDGETHTDENGDIWLDGDLALTLSEDVLKPYMIIYGEGSEYLSDFCRLSTEEEIKLFNEKVKEFEEAKKDDDWIVRNGDVYYTPSFDNNEGTFVSIEDVWEGISMEVCIKRRGWAFRTEEECQRLCDKLNEAIKNVKP